MLYGLGEHRACLDNWSEEKATRQYLIYEEQSVSPAVQRQQENRSKGLWKYERFFF